MGKLDGKVACITGGTRSIGRAMAEVFVSEGAKVVVNGRDEEKGQKCIEEMGAGDEAFFDDAMEMYDTAKKKYSDSKKKAIEY